MTYEEFVKKAPKSFFEEEVRNDYIVTSEIKKVWAIQLYLLQVFMDVCEKHNLKYYAFGGTLLGAIRHKGYIPWDDDLDVAMLRKDYDILCLHPEWFPKEAPLHLANNKENYYEGWARIHYPKSAVLYSNYKKAGSKQGIYLDIFPLDYATKRDAKNRKKVARINILGHAISYNANPNKLLRVISAINGKLHLLKPEKLFKKVNRLCCSNEKTDNIVNKTCPVYSLEKSTFALRDYAQSMVVPFEFIKILIPTEYDSLLKAQFKNYMEFPPVEQRGTWHNFFFDTESSYEEYNKNRE